MNLSQTKLPTEINIKLRGFSGFSRMSINRIPHCDGFPVLTNDRVMLSKKNIYLEFTRANTHLPIIQTRFYGTLHLSNYCLIFSNKRHSQIQSFSCLYSNISAFKIKQPLLSPNYMKLFIQPETPDFEDIITISVYFESGGVTEIFHYLRSVKEGRSIEEAIGHSPFRLDNLINHAIFNPLKNAIRGTASVSTTYQYHNRPAAHYQQTQYPSHPQHHGYVQYSVPPVQPQPTFYYPVQPNVQQPLYNSGPSNPPTVQGFYSAQPSPMQVVYPSQSQVEFAPNAPPGYYERPTQQPTAPRSDRHTSDVNIAHNERPLQYLTPIQTPTYTEVNIANSVPPPAYTPNDVKSEKF